MIAKTPEPPYYAVIFTSIRTDIDEGYNNIADHMVELASQQDGFLGIESASDSIGITVSYWKDERSINKWKQNIEHLSAQKKGIAKWYSRFKTRVAKVERDNYYEK